MGRLCAGSGRTGPPYAGALLTFCGRFLQLSKCGARGVCRHWSRRRAGRRRPAATACETLAKANGARTARSCPRLSPLASSDAVSRRASWQSVSSTAGRGSLWESFFGCSDSAGGARPDRSRRPLRSPARRERRLAARLPEARQRRMPCRGRSSRAVFSAWILPRVSTRRSRGGSLAE